MNISKVATPAPTVLTLSSQTPVKGGADADSPAQEALETASSKQAERANGGFAPTARPGGINKIA
jgi:hypothetical protein